MNSTIIKLTDDIFNEAVLLRRELHEYPELAFEEYKTGEIICNYLDKINIVYEKNIAKTGIVAYIGKDADKKTLLIRADMDALPIEEMTNLKYKSRNKGVMHACGHDSHMAIALGTIGVLSQLRDKLKVNLKFVFQPAEEGVGGAKPMIDAGVMKNPQVDACIGFHVMNDTDCGKVLVKSGEMMACPDDFDINIIGRGGHGAYPDRCVDPITVSAHLICALNSLSARFTNALKPKVLSICALNAGSFYNVIPDKVNLKGTLRLYDKEMRERLPKMIEETIKGITSAFGADYEFIFRYMYPPLINDEKITELFKKSAENILSPENVVVGKLPSMAGDDFAYFSDSVPSTYINIGGKNEKLGSVMPLHSSDYIIDEEAIRVGIKVLSKFAVDFE